MSRQGRPGRKEQVFRDLKNECANASPAT